MSVATITVAIPTARTDGTPFASTDVGGIDIFKDGNKITTLSPGVYTYSDSTVVPGVTIYTADVFDLQTPPAVSALSAPFTAPSLGTTTLAAPGAPTLTVSVA